MAGTLYIVSTPIGNLEDITLRAVRMLREADVIVAEDTRVTRKLLSHYDIHTHMISYHQHTSSERAGQIVEMLLEGKSAALVSDAGTPGISDPGHELIALCIEKGIAVQAIPGPVAFVTALVVSGMPTSHFAFEGFPPRKESERRAFFRVLRPDPRTICLHESPLRLVKTLQSIRHEMGERRVAVVREATKVFEEVFRGTVGEAIERFTQARPRGEIVIVLHGASPEEAQKADAPEVSLEERLRDLMESGMSERDAVRHCVAEYKLPKRQVYAVALAVKGEAEEQRS